MLSSSLPSEQSSWGGLLSTVDDVRMRKPWTVVRGRLTRKMPDWSIAMTPKEGAQILS